MTPVMLFPKSSSICCHHYYAGHIDHHHYKQIDEVVNALNDVLGEVVSEMKKNVLGRGDAPSYD